MEVDGCTAHDALGIPNVSLRVNQLTSAKYAPQCHDRLSHGIGYGGQRNVHLCMVCRVQFHGVNGRLRNLRGKFASCCCNYLHGAIMQRIKLPRLRLLHGNLHGNGYGIGASCVH